MLRLYYTGMDTHRGTAANFQNEKRLLPTQPFAQKLSSLVAAYAASLGFFCPCNGSVPGS
jgi:hypothetical protein